MENSKGQAVIDADFFIKLTEKDSSGELFLRVMEEMGYCPIMHQYVLDEELLGNQTAKQLVEKGHIKVLDHNDFLTSKIKNDYEEKFKNLYKCFNSQDFTGDVYTYRHCQQNLGEIRSSLMAWYLGIDILMSDDKSAKYYITSRLSSRRHRIEVYNVYDALKMIGQKRIKKIKWSEVKVTAKAAFAIKEDWYNEIYHIWHHS